MQAQLVFEEKKEMKRLRVQNDLLSCYEDSVLAQIFSGKNDIAVLDIGCNDGIKTVERFSSDSVKTVIGLEYNSALATKAQKTFGNEKFSFYHCDVEAEGFSEKLRGLMNESGLQGFDVIYLSFVLMHLSDVMKLLYTLRSFLKEDGKLMIIEANDSISALNGDKGGLLGEFLAILKSDKYSGNREVGKYICDLLHNSGYDGIRIWHDSISAGKGEKEKKKAIFTTFFSYLPEDIALLLAAEPENEEYKAWSDWIDRNYKTLKHLIMSKGSVISMGMRILTCTKGEI